MLPGKAAYGIPADRSSLDETATVCRHFLCLKMKDLEGVTTRHSKL